MPVSPYIAVVSVFTVTMVIFNAIAQFFGTYGVVQQGDLLLLNLILLLSVILAVYYVALKRFLRVQFE